VVDDYGAASPETEKDKKILKILPAQLNAEPVYPGSKGIKHKIESIPIFIFRSQLPNFSTSHMLCGDKNKF